MAQVLTYAAYLRGMSRETLEQDVLGAYLRAHEHQSIDSLMIATVQDGSFDATAFDSGLRSSLAEGRFRLVLVLDEAPTELIRLVGYLEHAASLVIDLVTVSSYGVGDQRLLVPQRVDPEHQPELPLTKPPGAVPGLIYEGSAEFQQAIEELPEPERAKPRRLLAWARDLEARGLARLITYRSKAGYASLLPFAKGESAGLVTLWTGGLPQVWRSVFARRAPQALARLDALLAPAQVGRGTGIKDASDDVLEVLTRAYEEAAGVGSSKNG